MIGTKIKTVALLLAVPQDFIAASGFAANWFLQTALFHLDPMFITR